MKVKVLVQWAELRVLRGAKDSVVHTTRNGLFLRAELANVFSECDFKVSELMKCYLAYGYLDRGREIGHWSSRARPLT